MICDSGSWASAIALDRACDVEVTQAGIAHTMDLVHPAEDVFDQQFALAIGVGGLELRVFQNGRVLSGSP